jgi:hypothetical protein
MISFSWPVLAHGHLFIYVNSCVWYIYQQVFCRYKVERKTAALDTILLVSPP